MHVQEGEKAFGVGMMVLLVAATMFLGWMYLPVTGGTASFLSAADRQFLAAAGNMGNSQAALGHLALQKAFDPAVRRYAQRNIVDHARIEQRLRAVAGALGTSLPTHLDDPIRGELARLSRLSGPAFDRELVRWEVLDFRLHVQQFRREATEGANAQIKRFAQEYVPVIQQHYRTAQQLAAR